MRGVAPRAAPCAMPTRLRRRRRVVHARRRRDSRVEEKDAAAADAAAADAAADAPPPPRGGPLQRGGEGDVVEGVALSLSDAGQPASSRQLLSSDRKVRAERCHVWTSKPG
eukprot:190945-Chlamydomonas_euryale.AAC.3